MKNSLLALALICIGSFTPVNAESLSQAITDGKAKLDIRYRFENVDRDNLAKDANASTIRTRLAYQTDKYRGFHAYFEVDDVRKIGVADYTTPNAGPLNTPIGPKLSGRPVVADPLDTELNQAFLSYNHADTTIVLGRQRIIRANARFIGNVGWRQHEQTFDAISIKNKTIKDLTLFGAYMSRRNTITFTDIDQDTILIDATYEGIPNGKLSAYYYDIKVDDSALEWENIGIRYAGKADKIAYTLEFAKQQTGAGAKPDYTLIEASYKFKLASITAGFEVLGSDAHTGFATPLATLHKFNGWADHFLATPEQGLQDKFLSVAHKRKDLTLLLTLHQFDADKTSIDFGSEINLLASKKLADNYTIGAKYADYSAGDKSTNKVDTSKLWLWAEAKF